MANEKMYLEAVDPPRTVGRRWKCAYCGIVGTIAGLNALPCEAGAIHPAPADGRPTDEVKRGAGGI